jgi:AbiV family abortive infection protein
MKDIDQKTRKALASGQNFRPKHFQLYRACLSNAYDLLDEADILLKKDRHARAYALAFTAAEEIGKALIVADWIYDLIPEEEFHNAFKNHHIKKTYLENVFSATQGEPERDVFSLRADFVIRMSALYVNKSNDGPPKVPQECVTRESAAQMIEKVREYLTSIMSAE